MNWEKMRSPTRATLATLFLNFFCELVGKSLKYSLTPKFKNPKCPKLSFNIENKGNLHKIRLVAFQI